MKSLLDGNSSCIFTSSYSASLRTGLTPLRVSPTVPKAPIRLAHTRVERQNSMIAAHDLFLGSVESQRVVYEQVS